MPNLRLAAPRRANPGYLLVALSILTFLCACRPTPEPAPEEPAPEVAAAPTIDPRIGAWERIPETGVEEDDDRWALIAFSEERATWATRDRVERAGPIVERNDTSIVASFWGNPTHFATTIDDGGHLTLAWTPTATPFRPDPERQQHRYRRLSTAPAALDLSPLPLSAPSALETDRVEALRQELAARLERDQAVREVFQRGTQPTPEQQAEMIAVDRDNTAWLVATIAEIGWIDVGRFGKEAARAAFLIVQHSGDLRLMLTALSPIEQDVQAGLLGGGAYALLYDRAQLNQGNFQRYGSQLSWGADGLYVAPLEDPATVDQRRETLGMEPLKAYLENFDQPEGGIPILDHF